MRLVMIDNYDSFTFNLVQLFYEFGLEVMVYRHDMISLVEIERLEPDWICISPGPKDPAHAGISKEVVRHFASRIPILGVCLGMQAINEVFSGRTKKAPLPMHGKRCQVYHSAEGIFSGIPSPFWTARYHSLCIELSTGPELGPSLHLSGVSGEIIPVARASDGVIMGIQHSLWPLYGVQFHPESFMTEFGVELIANFLALKASCSFPKDANVDADDRFPRFNRHKSAGSCFPGYGLTAAI